MALSTWTDGQILAQLISGSRWSGSTISYAFPTTQLGMYASDSVDLGGFLAVNAAQQAQIKLALQTWDDLIAPGFQQTTSLSSNIEFAYTSTTDKYAYAYFPTTGSVWFSSKYVSGVNNLVSPVIGAHGFFSMVHEIGHALGLEHMGNYSSSTALPSCYQDSTVYSVMSYFGPTASRYSADVADADWIGSYGIEYEPQTPMLSDIKAIQSIYGASTTTRAGDTTYGFHSNVIDSMGSILDFTRNLTPILTIFDSGGNDTLDLSAWSSVSTIDLTPGNFSSCNNMTKNIAIASNTVIENAIGGGGNDTLIGNSANNHLVGGSGDDHLIGGGGNNALDGGNGRDVAEYSGLRNTYQVSKVGSGYQVVGNGSTDTLTDIERLQFSDHKVALDIDGNAGQAYRLYQAAFNRQPDTGGLTYWVGILDNGNSLQTVSASFIASAEFTSLYGANPSNGQFVTNLYSNVLHRAPDQGGYDYWVNLLDHGTLNRVAELISFSESPENQAAVIGVIQNGIDLL